MVAHMALRPEPADPDPDAERTVLVIGDWGRLPGPAMHQHTELVPIKADERSCRRAIRQHWPHWVLSGPNLSDDDRGWVVQVGRLIKPDLRFAVLAAEADLASCQRWLLRGCSVILTSDSSVQRVSGVLRFAMESGIAAVDRRFQEISHLQQAAPVRSLTRREIEVLDRLQRGQRNHEIAHDLNVSASTVDFHVRNLLSKLGARNRVEAVSRAQALGL